MSKILKNDSGSTVTVNDTGVSIPNASQYTIQPQDYLLWAASSDVVTQVGNGNLVVNDGSFDLSISDGIDLIKGLFPSEVTINNSGDSPVKIDVPKGAFGALEVFQNKPYINVSSIYGIEERIYETFSNGTGSYANEVDNSPGREIKVSTGTDVGGYGVVRSKKVLTYKSGIGSMGRFTARFSTPVANSIQRVGFQNIGNELAFGYNGTQFGILKRSGGRPEIRKLNITNPANSNQTLTITLNGTAYNVNVTNKSAQGNAFEISNGTFSGWRVYNIGSNVYFEANTVDAKNGTYSVSSTGGFTGTFSQVAAGKSVQDSWYYQSDWNYDKLLTSDDAFILDHTKGNVYEIKFQYLGYGSLKFYIENPSTGEFVLVHDIHYSNTNSTPSLDLPNFKIGALAASLGSTTNIDVYCASLAAFHENALTFPTKVHSQIGSVSGISTTLKNVLAVKKTTLANNRLHISDIKIDTITAASEATKPVIFEVRLNPTFSEDILWQANDNDTPIVTTSTGGDVTGGELLYSVALSKSSNIFIDTTDLDMILSNDDVIAICARATNGTVDAASSVVWSDI